MSEIGTRIEARAGTTAPRKLTRPDREAAAKALAAAFWDDPLMTYIWPSDRMRTNILPVFMRGAIQLAAPHNESFTAEPQPVGGALWLPPGKTKIPLPTILRILLPDIWRWRPASLMRFMRIMDEFERKHVKSTHWYLMVLGVEPSKQGQGLGGLLMSDVLRRADAQGLRRLPGDPEGAKRAVL